ncbi:MAG TPA: hypothetical protein VF974_03535 [Patescibacteria group bacterium]
MSTSGEFEGEPRSPEEALEIVLSYYENLQEATKANWEEARKSWNAHKADPKIANLNEDAYDAEEGIHDMYFEDQDREMHFDFVDNFKESVPEQFRDEVARRLAEQGKIDILSLIESSLEGNVKPETLVLIKQKLQEDKERRDREFKEKFGPK